MIVTDQTDRTASPHHWRSGLQGEDSDLRLGGTIFKQSYVRPSVSENLSASGMHRLKGGGLSIRKKHLFCASVAHTRCAMPTEVRNIQGTVAGMCRSGDEVAAFPVFRHLLMVLYEEEWP